MSLKNPGTPPGTADSKDDSQREVCTLQNTAKNFGMEISTEKFETMAFLD